MENNSYLPTYTEAVQLDPTKLGKRVQNDIFFRIESNFAQSADGCLVDFEESTDRKFSNIFYQ